MKHEVKSWPDYFIETVKGTKNFEVRYDDRGYEVGDILQLREWNPDNKLYTGREIGARIDYIFRGAGLQKGYCVLGISIWYRNC